MRMFKFMLFVGVLVLCGLVNGEQINFESDPMYEYLDKDGVPELDFYLDLEKIGVAKNVHYNVEWYVTEISFESEQTDVAMNKLTVVSTGEKCISPLTNTSMVRAGEPQKDKIINGLFKVFLVGPVALESFAKWPEKLEPVKAYKVHYKIDQYTSKEFDTTVADFKFTFFCYWVAGGAAIKVSAKGEYDDRWEFLPIIGSEDQNGRKAMRSIRVEINAPEETPEPLKNN